jgi:hypothetical protein
MWIMECPVSSLGNNGHVPTLALGVLFYMHVHMRSLQIAHIQTCHGPEWGGWKYNIAMFSIYKKVPNISGFEHSNKSKVFCERKHF